MDKKQEPTEEVVPVHDKDNTQGQQDAATQAQSDASQAQTSAETAHSDAELALIELQATRNMLGQLNENLPSLEDKIKRHVKKLTRGWRIATVFSLIVGAGGLIVGATAFDHSNDLERLGHRQDSLQSQFIINNCEGVNEVREGFLKTVELLTGEPRDAQTDPETQVIVTYFAKKKCSELVGEINGN